MNILNSNAYAARLDAAADELRAAIHDLGENAEQACNRIRKDYDVNFYDLQSMLEGAGDWGALLD